MPRTATLDRREEILRNREARLAEATALKQEVALLDARHAAGLPNDSAYMRQRLVRLHTDYREAEKDLQARLKIVASQEKAVLRERQRHESPLQVGRRGVGR